MLVSKNANFASPPTPTPNMTRWNIGRVGSPTQNSCIGHVHLIFLVSISFALGAVFSGIWAFSLYYTLRFVGLCAGSTSFSFFTAMIFLRK